MLGLCIMGRDGKWLHFKCDEVYMTKAKQETHVFLTLRINYSTKDKYNATCGCFLICPIGWVEL